MKHTKLHANHELSLHLRSTAAIPPLTQKESIMKRRLPPPATLLIALVLACSAGAASAATTSTSSSWFSGMALWLECAAGNPAACMAADGGSGIVSPDTVNNPEIINK